MVDKDTDPSVDKSSETNNDSIDNIVKAMRSEVEDRLAASDANKSAISDRNSEDVQSSDVKALVIQELQMQIDELNDKFLRTNAEIDNIRKRYEKQIDDARDYAVVGFAKDLLDVVDNMCRALEHKPQNMDPELHNIILGVEMTKNMLDSILSKHGVSCIAPTAGEKFDYNMHYAVAQIETDDHQPGNIVGVMQAGYRIKERLLRPAMVSVAKANIQNDAEHKNKKD